MNISLAVAGFGTAFALLLAIILFKTNPGVETGMIVLVLCLMLGGIWGYHDELQIAKKFQEELDNVRDHK